MIIEQFNHDIDDGGLSESATLVFLTPGLIARPGITAEQLPPTLVAAMRAYVMGTVAEPVEWMIVEVRWDVHTTLGGGYVGRDQIEVSLRRINPSVVGPHDGNPWWRIYWPKVQEAQRAMNIFRSIGVGQ